MAKRAPQRRCCYCAGEGANKYLMPDNETEVEYTCQDCQGTGKLCVLCGSPDCSCPGSTPTCDRCGRYTYACKCGGC